MPDRWESINVDGWFPEGAGNIAAEPLGGKDKFWITGPDGSRYLFKFARCDPDGTNVRGEDWAEWAVHQLAQLIGVPTAVAVPATFRGRRGILSRALWRTPEQLIHGNELLAKVDPGYDAAEPRQNAGYTVEAVHVALADVAAPQGAPPILFGFDAWAGYLVLDAWVAGRDRHHENWAVIERSGSLRLAPSYDHGNALGFQESEQRIVELAADDAQLARWCRKGTSFHFAGRPALVDLADAALELAGSAVEAYWRSKLGAVTVDQVSAIFEAIPDTVMSEHGRMFRVRLLTYNQERIVR